jgi:hypothetical protein
MENKLLFGKLVTGKSIKSLNFCYFENKSPRKKRLNNNNYYNL